MRLASVGIVVTALGWTLVVRAQAPAEPIVPSSPHRVLNLGRQPDSWYLIEADKPLRAELDGPGLLELTLRRAVLEGEAEVQPTSVRVTLDDAMQPPITFRRAREDSLRFADEARFVPSAPRDSKIAIPVGSHTLRLELGSDTTAVAVALRYREASARAVPPRDLVAELPPLEPIPEENPPAAPAPALAASTQPAEQTEAAAFAPAEPPATPAPAETPNQLAAATPTADPPARSAATPAPVASAAASAAPVQRVGTVDLGIGLSTTFVNLGGSSPAMRLGARYIPPWLDGQLRLGAELAGARYSVRSAGDSPPELEASNWVFPLLAVAAVAPLLPTRWLELELGAGVGLAISAASLRYQGVSSGSAGVGGAAAVFAEAAVPLGPVAACARVQLDAISASNDIFRRFNYLGSSALVGARWWF